MIERADLEEYLQKRPPIMFHVTAVQHRESILATGLLPGSEMDRTTKAGFFHTRPGHVYLSRIEDLPVVEIDGARLYVQADLAKLDPALINPDEDLVQDSFAFAAGPWVNQQPPDPRHGSPDEHERALARWAETTEGFDSRDVTLKSLYKGRIAYRGTIPPAALTVVELRSEVAQIFWGRVLQELSGRVPTLAKRLGEPPLLEFSDIETGRAMALAELVLASAAGATGLGLEAVKLLRPEHASDYQTAFSGAATRHYGEGQAEFGQVASAAAAVAEAVLAIEPSDGWWVCREAGLRIGESTVDVIAALAALPGAHSVDELIDQATGRLRSTERRLSLRDLVT